MNNKKIVGINPILKSGVMYVLFIIRKSKSYLSKERVVFLGKTQAVVKGLLNWSNASEGFAQGEFVYEALIYLDYANGHWNYNNTLDMD